MLGDKEHPLRCSRLASLVKCSMRVYLLEVEQVSDEDGVVGPAAHTGSVVHAGVAEFHRNPNDSLSIRIGKGWEAIAKAMAEFPTADETEVRLFYEPYVNDARNINCEIPLWIDGTLAVEKQIDFTLPPHEIDESECNIYIQGTFDHIRMTHGVPMLYDLKTGKKTGWEMLHDHAIQVAAYTYGVRRHYIDSASFDDKWVNSPDYNLLQPGYIIRNYGYRARQKYDVFESKSSPDGVFFKVPFKYSTIEAILENVRLHVALYRNGEVNYGPGPHCTYCEYGGLTGCIDKYEQLNIRI